MGELQQAVDIMCRIGAAQEGRGHKKRGERRDQGLGAGAAAGRFEQGGDPVGNGACRSRGTGEVQRDWL
ncbi:hypothetical protein ACH4UM_15365 [Streptomyces sp. NPDC020801]|uniref:hypothetical protein n=1 Tax=Streptomyces sp. NPDC020801 TaxID=3365093 RepID=UPI00379C0189